jgi:hypothetical protein
MMKKLIIALFLVFPFIINAQDFSESMNKVETIKFINQHIVPEGNMANLSSLQTKVNFSNNYFDVYGKSQYDFDLRYIKFSIVSGKVRMSCTSGNCISYSYNEPEKEESKSLSSLDFTPKDTDVNTLYKAFVHLKKQVGL